MAKKKSQGRQPFKKDNQKHIVKFIQINCLNQYLFPPCVLSYVLQLKEPSLAQESKSMPGTRLRVRLPVFNPK